MNRHEWYIIADPENKVFFRTLDRDPEKAIKKWTAEINIRRKNLGWEPLEWSDMEPHGWRVIKLGVLTWDFSISYDKQSVIMKWGSVLPATQFMPKTVRRLVRDDKL